VVFQGGCGVWALALPCGALHERAEAYQQGAQSLAFLDNIFSFINMRSFSSVWFWIVLALYWSSVSQSLLGAPHDLILRAKREIPQDTDDMERLVYIHVRRKLEMMRRTGHWLVAFAATLLTAISILAFSYRLEFAQALFVLLVPIALVWIFGLRLCFRIEREGLEGAKLARVMLKHRLWMQALGVVAIFITAVWGMLHVMSRSALGL
jgi:hypothetical protein